MINITPEILSNYCSCCGGWKGLKEQETTWKIHNCSCVFVEGNRTGWICPKCYRSLSPDVKSCESCEFCEQYYQYIGITYFLIPATYTPINEIIPITKTIPSMDWTIIVS